MGKKITVYTRDFCASCANVKKYLDIKQHTYDIVNLDQNPSVADEIVAKSGSRSVPVVVVRDENTNHEAITVGWNPGRLASMLAS